MKSLRNYLGEEKGPKNLFEVRIVFGRLYSDVLVTMYIRLWIAVMIR